MWASWKGNQGWGLTWMTAIVLHLNLLSTSLLLLYNASLSLTENKETKFYDQCSNFILIATLLLNKQLLHKINNSVLLWLNQKLALVVPGSYLSFQVHILPPMQYPWAGERGRKIESKKAQGEGKRITLTESRTSWPITNCILTMTLMLSMNPLLLPVDSMPNTWLYFC